MRDVPFSNEVHKGQNDERQQEQRWSWQMGTKRGALIS